MLNKEESAACARATKTHTGVGGWGSPPLLAPRAHTRCSEEFSDLRKPAACARVCTSNAGSALVYGRQAQHCFYCYTRGTERGKIDGERKARWKPRSPRAVPRAAGIKRSRQQRRKRNFFFFFFRESRGAPLARCSLLLLLLLRWQRSFAPRAVRVSRVSWVPLVGPSSSSSRRIKKSFLSSASVCCFVCSISARVMQEKWEKPVCTVTARPRSADVRIEDFIFRVLQFVPRGGSNTSTRRRRRGRDAAGERVTHSHREFIVLSRLRNDLSSLLSSGFGPRGVRNSGMPLLNAALFRASEEAADPSRADADKN